MSNMIKAHRILVLLSFCALASGDVLAQAAKEPTLMTFEAKKKEGDQYDLIIHCRIARGWHIFAAKPGGDGTLTPAAITFSKSIIATYNGPVKEKGKLVTENIADIKAKVNTYENQVDFIQSATIHGKGKIFANFAYQTCNDKKCLPPMKKDIVFDITE